VFKVCAKIADFGGGSGSNATTKQVSKLFVY